MRDPGTLGLALPGDRQAELRGLVEGHRRRRGGARRARARRDAAARAARATRPACWSRSSSPAPTSPSPSSRGAATRACCRRSTTSSSPAARSRFNIYDYRLKSAEASRVSVRCPPDLPRDVAARLRAHLQDGGAHARHPRPRPHRLPPRRGRPHLPARGQRAALARAGRQHCSRRPRARGWTTRRAAAAIVEQRGPPPGAGGPSRARDARRPPEPLRIGFTYNVKRVDSKGGNDAEAEYDAPETIDAIRDALASYGHVVVPLEATAELPRQLMATPVDLVFNIAEGVAGRNREAQVPGAVRAARHPVHRLRRGDAVDRARQGALQAGAAASTAS